MTLSLSVRIAEEFASKEKASLSLPALAELAIAAGYDALCMRASQVGIHSPQNAVENAAAILAARRLGVTMITGNFDVVYNNEHGPACLRKIGPHLELAGRLGAPLIRVALKSEQDIDWAKRASDEAAEFGLKLVHQCHTQSLFETVEGIERTLRRIDRPNFGIIYEPANLELCGQEYGQATVERLAPWIFNVYLQNQLLRREGKMTLTTWRRGPVSFDLIPVHEVGGINFERVFQALGLVRYSGPITVHQAGTPNEPASEIARATASYLKGLARNSL
ncbi:MAG: sugar phosphate isomerase/epimerase [Verrucomicrobia bacterium]|nr:sugar phosphate isomerase/epimerase [Verrucomicrobiota bacterium]